MTPFSSTVIPSQLIDRLEIGAKIVDRIVRWLSPLVILALILLTVRMSGFGPTPEFVVQILLGAGMVAAAFLGRRLRPTVRILIYGGSLFLIGLFGIAQWGLMGSGQSLVVLSLIIFSLLGPRRWLVALAVALLGTILAAVGWVSGALPLTFDPAGLMRSIPTWAIALVSLATAGTATLIWEGLYSQLTKTSRALRESEDRYLTIFNTIHQALLVHDRDGRVLDLNQAASSLFGISRESALRMTISAHFSGPGSPVEDLPGIWQRVMTGEKIRLEWNVRRPGDQRCFPAEVWLEHIWLAGKEYVLANVRDLSEQEQAKAEISRERYFSDTLLESVPGMFYLYEIDEQFPERSHLLRYNHNHMLETGYSEEEMSRMTLGDWFEPQALPSVTQAIRLLDVDPQNPTQLNLRRKDGSLSPYAFTGRRLQLGDKTCFLGIGVDVSDYVRAQTALEQERDFSNSLIEGLPGVFCMIGPDQQVARWNHHIEEVTGYSRDEISKMAIPQFFDEGEIVRVAETIAQAFIAGKGEVEANLVTHDGQSIPYYFVGWRKELNGQPNVITFGMDITQRHTAERLLRESEERNRVISEMTTDYIMIIDIDVQNMPSLRWISTSYTLQTGNTPDQVRNFDNWSGLIHPEDRERFSEFMIRTIRHGEQSSFECRSIARKAGEHWIQIFCKPLRGADGRVISILSAVKDISERKQAELDLREANRELEKAYIATLQGWAQALELRERETADHSRRVVDLTLRTAKALGFEGEQLVFLERGALLHDIGKMGVPDNILLKPEPLTPDEWVIMRQHADYAFQLIRHIDFLQPSLAIPYCHHEHWDGSGYPRQLCGEEIPLEARIFTIVDVYDALCSNRPYRPAWKETDVLRYLGEQRGKQFDPRVVDVFLEVLKAK